MKEAGIPGVAKSSGRAASDRHYSLRRACAWIVCLLATLHCPAPDPTTTTITTTTTTTTNRDVVESAMQPKAENELAATDPTPAPAERPAIVFLGTSLTAGFGLPETEAYPALIQGRVDAAGLDYRVVNAGVSGDTSAGGLRRLDWLLRLPIAVLVVELGANDMLRGQPVEALESNLSGILERTRAAHPGVRFVVAGMRAAPNLGRSYAEAFDAVYPRLAQRHGAVLLPFLLEDVAARPDLNQADGIHPTAEGHALIAERVWRTLEPALEPGPVRPSVD